MSDQPGDGEGVYAPLSSALSTRVFDLIHEVLREHHGGGMVGSFLLVSDFVSGNGEPGWLFTVAPDQRLLTTTGLVQFAKAMNDGQLREAVDADE